MEEKLAQLLSKIEADEGLEEKFFNSETPEQVQSLLKEEGMDLTLEELNALKDCFMAAVGNGELSDEALEGVAGGSPIDDMIMIGAYQVGKRIRPILKKIANARW